MLWPQIRLPLLKMAITSLWQKNGFNLFFQKKDKRFLPNITWLPLMKEKSNRGRTDEKIAKLLVYPYVVCSCCHGRLFNFASRLGLFQHGARGIMVTIDDSGCITGVEIKFVHHIYFIGLHSDLWYTVV